jgi:phosphatidylinositol glycan class N
MASANVHVHEQSKILSLFLAFCPLFVILSISTEGLFYVTYSTILVLWIAVETSSRPVSQGTMKQLDSQDKLRVKRTVISVYRPQADDLRIALFFLFFVQVGFFGTGKWVLGDIHMC